MNIHVTFDVAAVKNMQRGMKQTIIPTVLMRSLNKTLKATHSTAVKAIANNMGVKQQCIKQRLVVNKAQRQKLTAILSAPDKRRLTVLEIDPHARQNARGVAYRMGGQKKQIDHAFIATMKSGHRGMYTRKPGAGRLPIRELQGTSVAHVFMQPDIQTQMKNRIDDRWQPLIDHELHYELQRRGYAK